LSPKKRKQKIGNTTYSNSVEPFTGFDDVIDLSLSQVFILLMMSVFPEGTVRYNVLQSINLYLSPQKMISASSFYNSLNKLEKKGFLEFSADNTGNISLVHLTPKSDDAFKQIGSLFSFTGFNFRLFLPKIASFIVNQLELTQKVDSILVISQEASLDVHVYPIIERYAKHLHVVATDDSFQKYILPYSSEIHQTKILSGKIREPDKDFDACYLSSYQTRKEFFDLSSIELLREAVRVTKSAGLVIVASFSTPKKVNHFIIDSFIELVASNPLIATISKDEVSRDLTRVGLKNVSVTEFNGVILGFGVVP
jgi:DNA-binding PadR family transcriptional regulator